MTQEQKEQFIKNEYAKIKGYQYKSNSQILYNLIRLKAKFDMENYSRPLYIDVKCFIKNYIIAADKLDYGYDEVREDKLLDACKGLENSQKLSIYYYIRRLCYERGLEFSKLNSSIVKLEYKIAWKDMNYCKALRLFMGSNLWVLLFAYLIYILIVFVCLHPAIYSWMEVFNIQLKPFAENDTNNYFLNTLGLLTGDSDLAPSIIPIGATGMVMYCIGKLIFFVLVVNFVMKKIEDYITMK